MREKIYPNVGLMTGGGTVSSKTVGCCWQHGMEWIGKQSKLSKQSKAAIVVDGESCNQNPCLSGRPRRRRPV
jgi:hypothetical protein